MTESQWFNINILVIFTLAKVSLHARFKLRLQRAFRLFIKRFCLHFKIARANATSVNFSFVTVAKKNIFLFDCKKSILREEGFGDVFRHYF
jgi:hypothetical protein